MRLDARAFVLSKQNLISNYTNLHYLDKTITVYYLPCTQVLVLLEWLEADSLKEQRRSVKMAFFTLKGRKLPFLLQSRSEATLKPLVSNRENTKLETLQLIYLP